jgi:glycosyltransferase involved in cell wall biosynthesis
VTVDSPPSVSVCIPTRNRAGELAELLEQLGGQTWEDLEIVVVDDGSSDGTRDVALAAAAANPRVRYAGLPEPAGVPGVVNAAVAAARGELIAFFHDHDRYAPEIVERLAEALRGSPAAGFSFCGIVATDPATGARIGEFVEPVGFGRRYDVVERFVRSGACAVAGCAVMVRRSHIPDPPFPPELGAFADVGLWCALSAAGPTPCVPAALATVQGWTPQDAVGKLNWSVIGQLGRLRRRYVSVVRDSGTARLAEHALIAWQTARLRALFLFGIARLGWRAQTIPERAATDAPYAVAAFVDAMQAVARHRA